jgi:protein subunit release factor A
VTDKLGKIHTSTVSLVVLPEPEKVNNMEKILKMKQLPSLSLQPEVMFGPNEIKLETMRSSGAGGANVNANSTAVRITHIPTGYLNKYTINLLINFAINFRYFCESPRRAIFATQ